MTSDFSVTIDKRIFNDIYYQYLNDLTRIQIFYGGAGSGKSVYKAQQAIVDVMKGERNYLIGRAVGRSIRKSVFNEVKKWIEQWGLEHLWDIRYTEPVMTCVNGYQIIFTGLDDIEKVKSITPEKGVITDIWLEEATECPPNTVKELSKRLRGGSEEIRKRIHLTFNPIIQDHWIYKDYFAPIGWADDQEVHQDERLLIRRTWYIHNKFLTSEDIREFENEGDKYYYDVYSLGLWGSLGNVIFTNWEVQDLSEMKDQFTNHRNGLDFGFSNDPAAILCSHYDRKKKTIYIYAEGYEVGLTNDLLADEIKKLIGDWVVDEVRLAEVTKDLKEGEGLEVEEIPRKCVGTQPIVADSAEPKSIKELRIYNIDCHGAVKGKDSVMHGIQWLQQQKIIVDVKCVNTQNELRQFKWKEDKYGNPIRQPMDFNNHLISALRYAYEKDMSYISINTKIIYGNYIRGRKKKEKELPF